MIFNTFFCSVLCLTALRRRMICSMIPLTLVTDPILYALSSISLQTDFVISCDHGIIIKWSEKCQEQCISHQWTQHLQKAHRTKPKWKYHWNIKISAKCSAKSRRLTSLKDCAINLLPGTTQPKGRVYPLSLKEQKAMEEYIPEALAQKYIVPSTFRASGGFLFVEKKDGRLRLCNDYKGLNDVLMKYSYPLPLIPYALKQLKNWQSIHKIGITQHTILYASELVMNGKLFSAQPQVTTISSHAIWFGICSICLP